MSELRNRIRQAIANHPNVSLVGLHNLLSSDKKSIKEELKQMKLDGLLETTGRYYKLKPMYTQQVIHFSE